MTESDGKTRTAPSNVRQHDFTGFVWAFYGLSVLALISSVSVVIAEALLGNILSTALYWILALIGFVVGSTGYQLVRTLRIWKHYREVLLVGEATRSESEQKVARAGFRELHYYLIFSLSLLAVLSFLSASQGYIGLIVFEISPNTQSGSFNFLHVAIVLTLLLLSFLPVALATWLQARTEAGIYEVPFLRDDVVSPTTFLILSAGSVFIVSLAWAAGAKVFSIDDNFGVVIIAAVMAAFALFVVAPHVTKHLRSRREKQGLEFHDVKVAGFAATSPAAFISVVDSILVRLIAPLSGATQNGVPHLLVILVVLALSALGYVIAAPFGLVPIGIAILLVLALGRRWAWVEEDTETASRLQAQNKGEIHIGFSNDLRDEALLGYASLFVLVPLVLHQLQSVTGAFVETGSGTGSPIFDWLRFFGAELAKAVPFVDWWEIYEVEVNTPFDASKSPPLAKHLTFAARAIVDLVIMAALFQALSIWQRRRAQQRLYNVGHLNAFDPFTERAFFTEGMRRISKDEFEPSDEFKERVRAHADAREALHAQRLPYSHRRLSDLICSPEKEIRAGAAWMVEEYGVLAGTPRVQLGLLQRKLSVYSLPKLAAKPTIANRQIVHDLKADLERITHLFLNNLNLVSDQEIGQFADILKSIKGSPEMSYGHTLIIDLLGYQKSELAALVLADHLIQDQHLEDLQRIIGRMTHHMLGRPNLFQDHFEMRLKVYDSLEKIGLNQYSSEIAKRTVREVCTTMSRLKPLGDKSKQGVRRAKDVLEAMQKVLS